MKYNYSDIKPLPIIYTRCLGQKVYTINFNIEEVDNDTERYRFSSVTLPVGQYDRATVISAIIRQRYSDDEMQAIINNYLLDPNDAEAVAEFNQMQQYRKFAKKLADEFIEAIKED